MRAGSRGPERAPSYTGRKPPSEMLVTEQPELSRIGIRVNLNFPNIPQHQKEFANSLFPGRLILQEAHNLLSCRLIQSLLS